MGLLLALLLALLQLLQRPQIGAQHVLVLSMIVTPHSLVYVTSVSQLTRPIFGVNQPLPGT